MADERYDGTRLTSWVLRARRSTTKFDEFFKASKQTEQQSSRDISSLDPIYTVTSVRNARYILLSNVCVVFVKCIYGNFSRVCCCGSGAPSILSCSANSTSFGVFDDIECMRPLHTRLIEWWDTWQRKPKYLGVSCTLKLHSTVMIIAVNIEQTRK